MVRPRRLLVSAAVMLTAGPVAIALAQTTTPESESERNDPQTFFSAALQADKRTSSPIKRLLASKAGFVDSRSGFVDVTGDGRSDAIVLVTLPGAAGTVALYLFSTDGGSKGPTTADLRAVFRSQQLYRATFRLRNGTLVVRTPVYAKGDEPHAPSKIEERDYVWSDSAVTMRRVARRTVTPPRGGADAPR